MIQVTAQDIREVATDGRKVWQTEDGEWELTRADVMAIHGEWDGNDETFTDEVAELVAQDLNERQPWMQW
ncbi:MAG: hypothetical protein IRY92_04605 [Dactylosporangium sp.]|nr:hypothetical protein [Dactylosporangium sp.]